VTNAAARSGSYGAELNDTGVGVPAIEQKIPVSAEVYGQMVSVTAWVRLVTFPAMRLLVEANDANGFHLTGTSFSDTAQGLTEWQKLSTSTVIPAGTDHLVIAVGSALVDAAGVAYVDDVTVCMAGLCRPCLIE